MKEMKEETTDESEREFWRLIDMLKNEDFNKRWTAAETLGKLGDPRAIDPLIESLAFEISHFASAQALIKFGERALVSLLNKLASEENVEVNQSVINILSVIQDRRAVEPLIKIAKDVNSKLRTTAIFALSRFYNDAINSFFIELVQNDLNPNVRIEAIIRLGRPKNLAAVETLIETLNDKDESLVADAVGSLGQIGDVKAVRPLIRLLKHKTARLRQRAAIALGYIGAPEAVDPLIDALKDEYIVTRQNAASALASIGDKRAIKPLIELLREHNMHLLGFVIEALGVLADPEALPILQEFYRRSPGIGKAVLGTPIKEVAFIAIERIRQREAGSSEPFEFFVR